MDYANSYLDSKIVISFLLGKHNKGCKLLPECSNTHGLPGGRFPLCPFWKQEIHVDSERWEEGQQFYPLPLTRALQHSDSAERTLDKAHEHLGPGGRPTIICQQYISNKPWNLDKSPDLLGSQFPNLKNYHKWIRLSSWRSLPSLKLLCFASPIPHLLVLGKAIRIYYLLESLHYWVR